MHDPSLDRHRTRPSGLPSPHPSPPSMTAETAAPTLPIARVNPLKPGSQKEIALINYLDSRILQINRRYAKKYSSDRDETDDEAHGYDQFEDVVKDLEHVLDAVWVSGTSTLQVPYLLSMAGIVADYLPAFPFARGPTFRIVDKLDQAFAILLRLHTARAASDADDRLDYLVSLTVKVRIRSVIERCRIIAVEVSERGNANADLEDASRQSTDTEDEKSRPDDARMDQDSLGLAISHMYERSLGILGASLG